MSFDFVSEILDFGICVLDFKFWWANIACTRRMFDVLSARAIIHMVKIYENLHAVSLYIYIYYI